jgi:hypothetical protein
MFYSILLDFGLVTEERFFFLVVTSNGLTEFVTTTQESLVPQLWPLMPCSSKTFPTNVNYSEKEVTLVRK